MKLNKLPDILKDDGYPDVQAFMKTYRKAEAIITQYNQDLAEWEQTVKNGQKPAEKQHRPPERQSVRAFHVAYAGYRIAYVCNKGVVNVR